MYRHTQKILEGLDRLPDPLTQKADAEVRVGANATLHMSQDGTVWLKLYRTIVARSDREGLWAAHGGHRTATTMVWLLSALQAFQGRGGYFQQEPVTGHRLGGGFMVGKYQLETEGLQLVRKRNAYEQA